MRDSGDDAGMLGLIEEALGRAPEERDQWLRQRCGGDRPLYERLARMLRASEGAAGRLRTGGAPTAFAETEIPERIGAYRITGLIGQGGMGAVYRGERAAGDFDHVAAIKLIRSGALSETLIERFQRERQMLARLSHPHIARLFDGGETEAGDPYIIMECIDGVPLGTWLAEHRPTRDERIRLFQQVCSAVAFAHQNLIIHRDITPANVLVERDGTAKLIDFGIARPAAEGEAEGEGAAPPISLTPGYAAPERLAGAPATTLSDIYSLGKLLDHMLDGPLDADLRAIVAKATSADPRSRYPTADALSEDVAAWLEGRAVQARGGGRGYAIGKFVRRHRLAVGAAAAALVLLVAALVLTLAANRRAEIARAQAEERFNQTRSIAKMLLFDAYDEVGRIAGGTAAKAMLARTGLAYLDALAADPDAPLDVRVEAGRGYTRLANVVGGGGASNLGRFADANDLLGRATAVLAPLHAAQPDHPEVRRAYAALLVERAAVELYNNNDPSAARRLGLQADRLLDGLAKSDAGAAHSYASALQVQGDSFGWDDEWLEARAPHERAERFHASLPPEIAAAAPLMLARAGNLRLLGEAYHKSHAPAKARAALDTSVAVSRRALALSPDDPARIRRLSQSLWYRAVVHRSNGRDRLAGESIDEAVAHARRLRDRDPNDAGGLQMFAITGEVRAQVLADLGRYAESYAAGDEVIAAHRRLVELAGNTPGARRSMASALRTRGGNHYNGGDYAGACRSWNEALAIFADLERADGLTGTDRNRGVAELQDFTRRSCDPPRAGLGPKV